MPLRTALGQIGPRVGDVDGNVERILDAWRRAADQGADVIVFPELTTTGYPPEDLLLKPAFIAANTRAIERLAAEGPSRTVAIVGYVGVSDQDLVEGTGASDWEVTSASPDGLTNSAAVLADGRVVATYDKLRLPNYGVFDEARYFTPADRPVVVAIGDVPVGVAVCEDLWLQPGPVTRATDAGARLVVTLNASPYHRGKQQERHEQVAAHARDSGAWLAYVNAVGGQDEVVFDGRSFVVRPDGEVVAEGAAFEDDLVIVDLPIDPVEEGEDGEADAATLALPGADRDRPPLPERPAPPRLDPVGEVWHATVRATRDYCHHNGFRDALIGLSGGLDSAVVAAIAVDALGPDHVTGLLMPSPYSSDHSLTDAEALADALGIERHTLRIDDPLHAVGDVLGDLVITGFGRPDGREPGVAYENLQSRLRGLLLMALSNETGAIVLTTGNKSEYAVGYATLYGDMAGGFAPIKDVPKLLVFEMARWRNANPAPFGGPADGEVIPRSTIDKPPSAELRPDQRDDDSLPPYEVLDAIVAGYVEELRSAEQMAADGIADEDEIRRVIRLIDTAEFKRRQSAPGPKVTSRAFGRERRVPMTHTWRD